MSFSPDAGCQFENGMEIMEIMMMAANSRIPVSSLLMYRLIAVSEQTLTLSKLQSKTQNTNNLNSKQKNYIFKN